MSEQKVRNRPEISVIVPVYRVEKYLNDCIDSILAQTFADFELILVDDGSPDSCPALCDAAAARDSRIRVIHQKNRGLSGARNAGLDIAQGRWAAFVDSDDMLLPQALEKAHSTAEKTGADVVLYGFAFTDENGKDRMAEVIEANYYRIKQEAAQIVEDELRRIADDPKLKHLFKGNETVAN